MKMKKWTIALLAIVIMAMVFTACQPETAATDAAATDAAATEAGTTEAGDTEAAAPAEGDPVRVGAFFYQYSDTYTSTVRSALEQYASEMNLELNLQDAQNNQGTQNDQIPNVISRGADVLLMNIVDTGAAANVINQAKNADIPIIFFNREPEDIGVYASYDKSRFVGTKKEDAGIIKGKMIAELWNSDPEKFDRNGNGQLDYVMLHGGLDNAEAIARTEYSVKTIEEAGIETNEIGMQIAQWDTERAKNAMDAWATKDIANIDVVIANNDGMAIGAINSLRALGYNSGDEAQYIPVFGVDATEEAKEAIAQGSMAGTVLQDADVMAKALAEIARNAGQGKDFLDGLDYEYDDSGVAVRIPYQPYTE